MCKGLVSWWRVRFIYPSKTVPMIVKYWRGHGHVYSTALNGRFVHGKPTSYISPLYPKEYRRQRAELHGTDRSLVARQMEEDASPVVDRKNVDTFWMTTNWTNFDGDVRIMKAQRSILGWRTTTWWRNRSAWVMATDPTNVTRWKHKFGFHNRECNGASGRAKGTIRYSLWRRDRSARKM